MASAIARVLQLQGRTCVASGGRRGLNPLVRPLAESPCGEVIGSLRWPLQPGAPRILVASRRRPEPGWQTLRPCGTAAQYATRAAVEADASAATDAPELIAAAAAVAGEAGTSAYEAGAFGASKLRLEQFLLLRVGPFVDAWGSLVAHQLERDDVTAALVAAERAAATNPGWGCAMWAQAELMARLGRREERRDSALAALEAPFWTLGTPLAEVQAAAELGHIADVRAFMRELEERSREKQGAPRPTEAEAAVARALDALDAVVRRDGEWDEASGVCGDAMRAAGLAGDMVDE